MLIPTAIVEAGAGIGLWDGEVRKAADESVASSTVLQNDDELFFTATTGIAYRIEVYLIYGSPAGAGTPDIKYAFGEDATSRGLMSPIALFGTTETPVTAGTVVDTDQTDFNTAGTAAGNRVLCAQGWHVGNGGTFRVLWAQNTSGINATVVRAGSLIRYLDLS